jgi:hypothetical protein
LDSLEKKWTTVYAKGGKPPSIDQTGLENGTNVVKALRANGEPPNFAETARVLQAEADASPDRRGLPRHVLSTRTYQNYFAKAKLHERKPQITSPARQKACSDFRMVYSTMVMANSYVKNINPMLLWNFDFITFVIPRRGSNQSVYIADNDDPDVPVSVVEDEALPFAIKWVHLANAAGSCGPLIFIVAIDSIPPDKHYVAEVRGLSYNNDSTQTGYLVLCHTRNATDGIYRWFLKDIVIPTVNACRQYWNLRDEINMPLFAVVLCDGEDIVIEEVFNNDVLESFYDHDIYADKLCASTSRNTQPLDKSKCFLATKKRLQHIFKNDENVMDLL